MPLEDEHVAYGLTARIGPGHHRGKGLDQEFNSLDAQREAAEAFIQSQRREGWIALPALYDDGGFTGANMDRPALKRLLQAVEARELDCVVVYKVDRLSRSLEEQKRLAKRFTEDSEAYQLYLKYSLAGWHKMAGNGRVLKKHVYTGIYTSVLL